MGRRTLVTPAGPLVRGAANGGASEPRTAGACRPPGGSTSPGLGVEGRATVRVLVVEDEVVLAEAMGRRSDQPTPPVLARGDLVVDRVSRRVSRAGQFLRLTRKELGVLEVLLAADGAVISAEELLERVWDEHADPFTNTVRVTVGNLRRKLGTPPLIE